MNKSAKNSDLYFPPKSAPPAILMAAPSFWGLQSETQESSLASSFLIPHPVYQHLLLVCLSKYLQNSTTSYHVSATTLLWVTIILFFTLKKFFYTISKGYFPFTVIRKYWLYAPCCTILPWVYLTPRPVSPLVAIILLWVITFTSQPVSQNVCLIMSFHCPKSSNGFLSHSK